MTQSLPTERRSPQTLARSAASDWRCESELDGHRIVDRDAPLPSAFGCNSSSVSLAWVGMTTGDPGQRTCCHGDCSTRLSRYNRSAFCSIHEGHPPVDVDAPAVLAAPGCRHAETRPWDASLFRPSTKAGRGLCSRPSCTRRAVWAWLEQRPGFHPAGWNAFCDDDLPYTADQLTADAVLNELGARLHAAERAQRDRLAVEALAARGITWHPASQYPSCIGCDHRIVFGEDHSRLLRPGHDPLVVHAECVTVDVLIDAGWIAA